MSVSTQLLTWAKQQALPWLQYDEATGRLVLIVDNTLLSMYRGCPAYFFLKSVEGWQRKSISGDVTREWALDFGTLFHRMMELYYKHFREPDFVLTNFAIKSADEQWRAMHMDVHLGHKECQAMGGYPGFAGMLIQYATQFRAENERMRVLATEVGFGKNREVPIFNGTGPVSSTAWCEADIFLSGRLDIIADDGFYIFPVDHKTLGSFTRGDPMNRYIVDDGPTGYIYALNTILPTLASSELITKRECSRIQMNLISKAIPKDGSRFKRLPLYKSTAQLEAYRLRTIQTCNHLLADLELYIRGAAGIPRDTSKCENWYFKTCPYQDVHRQATPEAEAATLKNGFVQLPIWDTEAVAPVEEA